MGAPPGSWGSPGDRTPVPANERLKGSFDALVWGGIVAAVVVHFALFDLWPAMRARGVGVRALVAAEGFESLAVPPDVKIPAAPGEVPRPATPTIASSVVAADVTIPRIDFATRDAGALPAPPGLATGGGAGGERSGSAGDASAHPAFTPYTVAPELLNREQVVRAMKQYYPTAYRQTRTGGAVLMYLYIDERGRVLHEMVAQGSGYPLLDSAAVKVARVYRFRPAWYRDRKAAVWVQIPIVFSVTAGAGGG